MNFTHGSIFGGKYTITRCLGKGNQAQVWEARQSGIGGFSKQVVLKLASPHGLYWQSMREAIINEARIASQLRHPHIVEFYDIGEDQATIYIAMEYLEGCDLAQLLDQSIQTTGRPLPWDLSAYLMLGICDALDYAYHHPDKEGQPLCLVHRDIKPANLLVTWEGQAKIIDFGVAKQRDNATRTKTGAIRGTPAYMAPEQIRAGEIDGRADLFAVGCTLYELCSGVRPFGSERKDTAGETPMIAALMDILLEQPKPLDIRRLGIPESLARLIFQLLEKNPAQRLSRGSEVRASLLRILQQEGRTLTPEDAGVRVRNLFKKNPTANVIRESWALSEEDIEAESLSEPLPTSSQSIQEIARDLQQTHAQPSPPSASRNANKLYRSIWIAAALLFGGIAVATTSRFFVTERTQQRTSTQASDSTPYTGLSAKQRSLNTADLPIADRPIRPMLPSSPRPTTASTPDSAKNLTRPVVVSPPASDPSPIQRFVVSPSKKVKRRKPPIFRPLKPTVARRKQRPLRHAAALPISKQPDTIAQIAPSPPSSATGDGFVLFDITPRCQIFEGTAMIGTSQALLVKRPTGAYLFRCIEPNHRLHRRFHLKIQPNQIQNIRKHYGMGKLFVLSFPWSDIYLPPFGRLGRSQSLLSLPEGEYRVILYLQGQDAHKKTLRVRIRAGETSRPLVRW